MDEVRDSGLHRPIGCWRPLAPRRVARATVAGEAISNYEINQWLAGFCKHTRNISSPPLNGVTSRRLIRWTVLETGKTGLEVLFVRLE